MNDKWTGEWCGRCDRRNTVGFSVSDELWSRIVGDPNVVRCLTCFDEEAQEKGVRYTGADIYEFFPVSWNDWDDGGAAVFQNNVKRAKESSNGQCRSPK